MNATAGPEVLSITRETGVAGQYSYRVTVQYEGEGPSAVEFVGSAFGGPIVMVTGAGQTFVSEAVLDRIGRELSSSWVRRFFGEE